MEIQFEKSDLGTSVIWMLTAAEAAEPMPLYRVRPGTEPTLGITMIGDQPVPAMKVEVERVEPARS